MSSLVHGLSNTERKRLPSHLDSRFAVHEPPSDQRLEQCVGDTERAWDGGPGHADIQQEDPVGLVARCERANEAVLVWLGAVQGRSSGTHTGVEAGDTLGHLDAVLGLLLAVQVG